MRCFRAAAALLVSVFVMGGMGGCRILSSARTTTPVIPVHFTEVAQQAGVGFTHVNGAYGRKLMPETVGSGVAFLDYDNDGFQDLLIVNSTSWPGHAGPRGTPHLYHNNGNGTFTDVTKQMGLDFSFYGMGVAVGDYDNDGYEDIYLTAVGANHLLHNDAGRGFTDVTARAGVAGVPEPGIPLADKWSTGAAWLDYDNDGKLDLFVCQYVNWTPQKDPWCGHQGIRGYCPPDSFTGSHCTLYRNLGGGRFADVSRRTGIRNVSGKSFGIGMLDFNGDGWPDIAVTNDTWPNFLFLNDHGKKFREQGIEAGIAYGEEGKAKAGMGIDVADWRNNGTYSIVVGNFAGESLSLFDRDPESRSDVVFDDVAHQTGIASPSLLDVTFAAFFFDYDLDGWPDLLATNGHVDDIVNIYKSNLSFKEPPLLFRNTGHGHFTQTTRDCGLDVRMVGRGAAFADYDNDGDLDVAIVDNGGKFRLFRNDGGSAHHWIRFRAEGIKSNRDGIGTVIDVTANGMTQSQHVRSGGSYLSENQRALTFGLGQAGRIDHVKVRWPSGAVDSADALAANHAYVIQEGRGIQKDPRFRPTENSKL